MKQAWRGSQGWTRELVETWLEAAFCALPSHPVFSVGRLIAQTGSLNPSHIEVLNWPARFVPDRGDRLALMTWARCRATGTSVRDCWAELNWKRSSAEDARRRAARQIAAGLNGRVEDLDSRTTPPGTSNQDEANDALVML